MTKIYPLTIAKLQPDAILDQNNPVSGTQYPLLAAVKNAQIISIMTYVTWTVQPDVEIHGTIDGIAVRWFIAAPVSDTVYMAELWRPNDLWNSQRLVTTNFTAYGSKIIPCNSIKLDAETTGGTVSKLYAIAKWGKY